MEYAKKNETRSAIVDAAACGLKLLQSQFGTWTVSGKLPGSGGRTITGCKTLDDAVAFWIGKTAEV
jgi:hypothetical protein